MFSTKIFAVVFLLTIFVSNSMQITVECEYQELHGWKVVGVPEKKSDPYGCIIRTLDVKTKTSVTSATGKHYYGNTDSGVKGLSIYGRICEIIPSGFGSVFPNIEVFAVTESKLKTVSKTDLKQFSKLREIWLYVNDLEYLDSNLFEYNTKVECVYFKGNKIKYIGANFFDYLRNLRQAFFWYNDCINSKAEDTTELAAIKEEIKQNCAVPKSKSGEDLIIGWEDFQTLFNKTYANEAEQNERRNIFHQNQRLIKAHNILYEQGTETYSLGINKFGDWTHSEYLNINGVDESNVSDEDGEEAVGDEGAIICNSPETKDWRKEGAVTRIRDQLNCSSCYAFSAVGALEGQFFIKNGVLKTLSEQELIDCTMTLGNNGCNKGFMTKAFKYTKDAGIANEDAYPYEGKDNQCRASPNANKNARFRTIPKGNEEELKNAVCGIGPISVALDATQEDFRFVKDDIYFNKECKNKVSHAVLAVGYGTDKKTGLDYWIIKNSHGSSWGEGGFGKIARNKENHCAIANLASYPII